MLIVRNGMITEEQAKKGHNIASIDFSKEGAVFKFTDESYAMQFFHALSNSNYVNISHKKIDETNAHGRYIYSVSISSLNDVKKFIEKTCSYSDQYTKDLFAVGNIKLSSKFFIEELILIGKTNGSSSEKAEKAKNFIDKFLPFIDTELQKLKSEVRDKAATSYDDSTPNPLQYLREKRGLGSIFSDEKYGDTNTYLHILKAIDTMINSLSEKTTKNVSYNANNS